MTVTLQCKLCRASLLVAEGRAGQPMTCPRCGEQMIIPAFTSAAAGGMAGGMVGIAPAATGSMGGAPGAASEASGKDLSALRANMYPPGMEPPQPPASPLNSPPMSPPILPTAPPPMSPLNSPPTGPFPQRLATAPSMLAPAPSMLAPMPPGPNASALPPNAVPGLVPGAGAGGAAFNLAPPAAVTRPPGPMAPPPPPPLPVSKLPPSALPPTLPTQLPPSRSPTMPPPLPPAMAVAPPLAAAPVIPAAIPQMAPVAVPATLTPGPIPSLTPMPPGPMPPAPIPPGPMPPGAMPPAPTPAEAAAPGQSGARKKPPKPEKPAKPPVAVAGGPVTAPPGGVSTVASPPPGSPQSPPLSTQPPQPPARISQTARFIAADPSALRVQLGADGKLPELLLEDADKKQEAVAEEKAKSSSPPWLLMGVFATSIAMSLAMLFIETDGTGGGGVRSQAAARVQMKQLYAGDYPPLAPYQLRVRQALQAFQKGDREEERRLLREVLDILHAESKSRTTGITGMIDAPDPPIGNPSDRHLESLISTLLAD